MCIFSKSVTSVAATHIFARRNLTKNRHVTVYQMEAMLNGYTAMILPVPGTDVEFVSLEEYPDFFKDMDKLFPQNTAKGITRGRSLSFSPLPVYEVGNYIATYVPSMNDWHRVDPVFRLKGNCWDELPDYSEYGFVVFQLQAKNGQKSDFHPMAYTYTPNNENQIFFPTTHVHDGEVEKTSLYDHKLYFQLDDGFNHPPARANLRSDWEVSSRTIMDFAKCQNLVSRFSPIARIHLDKVMLPNHDIIVALAELDTVVTLANKIREKPVKFGVNDFAGDRHFSENSGFSYTTMSYEELIAEISKNWKNRRPGKGEISLDRKVVVPISNEKVFGVYTKIKPGMKITSEVVQRQVGEDYYIENTLDSPTERIQNSFAKVVLYSREALLENNGSCSTDADWEVVCLISTDVDDEPMQPLAMARNMLEKAGGTSSTYSAQEFAESIYYWSQRVKSQ